MIGPEGAEIAARATGTPMIVPEDYYTCSGLHSTFGKTAAEASVIGAENSLTYLEPWSGS